MKAILMSIKPKWIAKILNGEKTIEIRKTMPKCELPIDVYIYCTKDKNDLVKFSMGGVGYKTPNFKQDYSKNVKWVGNGKVVAKFTLNKVEKFDLIEEQKYKGNSDDDILKYNECLRKQKEIAEKSCLTICDLVDYCDTKALGINQKEMSGYAWHISNLVIFDRPRELGEFNKVGWEEWCAGHPPILSLFQPKKCYEELKQFVITKAPQSWQFIEVEGDK